MAALLVALSVAAVLMTALMPAWKQMARREKEAELIFRGEQYARAIGLFQRRSGPGVLPPNIDVLVDGRYLRKKFKDPITGQDFDTLSPVQAAGSTGPGAGTPGAASPGAGGGFGQSGAQPAGTGSVVGAAPSTGRGAVGGITGVASKSKEESLRTYKGRTRYNEWQFLYVAQTQQAGQGGPAGGANTPGGAGGPGGIGGVGGRGRGGFGDGRGEPFGTNGPQGPRPFGQQPPTSGPQGPTGQPRGQAPTPSPTQPGGSIFAPRR